MCVEQDERWISRSPGTDMTFVPDPKDCNTSAIDNAIDLTKCIKVESWKQELDALKKTYPGLYTEINDKAFMRMIRCV